MHKLIEIAYQLYKETANHPNNVMSNLLSGLKLSNEDVSLAYFQMVDENTKMYFCMKYGNESYFEPIQLFGKLDYENFEPYIVKLF